MKYDIKNMLETDRIFLQDKDRLMFTRIQGFSHVTNTYLVEAPPHHEIILAIILSYKFREVLEI